MTALTDLSLREAAKHIRSREISSRELTQAYLARIEAVDRTLRAFLSVCADRAMDEARRVDEQLFRAAPRSELHGIPVALKDLFDTADVPTVANSAVWDGRVPGESASVGRRLSEAGAILLGKLQMNEFAIGPVSDDDYRPPARNPWALDRSPGGSSSGSAVALASGMCAGSFGSDTGGSIRAPAAHCGIVGLKPTLGRLSRHGMAKLSWSLDHAGPMARRVGDVAVLLQATAGRDPHDPASSPVLVPDYIGHLTESAEGIRIGVPSDLIDESPVDASVRQAFAAALTTLRDLGATVVETRLPDLSALDAVFSPLLFVEAASVHAYGLRNSRPYGTGFRGRVLQGFLYTGLDYVNAQRGRAQLIRQFREVMEDIDLIATPTMGVTAPAVGTDPDAVRSPFTRIFNVTGQPSISIPCGFDVDGLPIGLMLTGRWFDEVTVLHAAACFEAATEWHGRAPSIEEITEGE